MALQDAENYLANGREDLARERLIEAAGYSIPPALRAALEAELGKLGDS